MFVYEIDSGARLVSQRTCQRLPSHTVWRKQREQLDQPKLAKFISSFWLSSVFRWMYINY